MTKAILAALILAAIYYLFLKPNPAKRPAAPPPPAPLAMPESEARAILGVAPDAGSEEIRTAHRRLLSALHPDKGGSAELTRRINDARDILLRRGN